MAALAPLVMSALSLTSRMLANAQNVVISASLALVLSSASDAPPATLLTTDSAPHVPRDALLAITPKLARNAKMASTPTPRTVATV